MIKDLLFSADISSVNRVPLSGRYVYFIVDEEDTIIYIGQTCSPAFRMCAHKGNNDFDYLKMIGVDDGIDLCDVEFMEIMKHKPIHNRVIPTPTFLIAKSRIILNGEEDIYDIEKPDLHLTMHGKDRYFWLKNEFKGFSYFESMLHLINKYEHPEKESDGVYTMLNRLINELEVK